MTKLGGSRRQPVFICARHANKLDIVCIQNGWFMHNQYRFGQYTLTCWRVYVSKDFNAYFQTDRLKKDTLKAKDGVYPV